MFKNYFKAAVRSLSKNKVFSFINVFGLAIGLACCMFIAVFVFDELSYDKYPANANRIYRVDLGVMGNNDMAVYPVVDVAVGEGIKNELPGVEATTRINRAGDLFVRYNIKQFKEQLMSYADSNFLNMFSIPLIKGDQQSALVKPNTIVVTEAFAKKYFGDEDPLGKNLLLGDNHPFEITGVIKEVPANSHFHFDAFISMASRHITEHTWSNIGFYTYILLKPGTDAKTLEARFPELVSKHVVPEIEHDMGVTLAEAQKSVNTFKFSLFPLVDIHLHSNTKFEIEANGDIQYVYIFGALAIFILLLACVNFTNLSTASSAKRAREVGIRKVMGSLKSQLISQFLAESVLLTFLSIICAYTIVFFLLPYFNQLSGKHIAFGFFLSYQSIIAAILLTLLVGILAGIYPAFFLSSFNTIAVLKSSSSKQGRKSFLRSSLVVFQFFVSTALIIATIIVYRQLHYMEGKKLGYDKSQVLYLQDTYLLGNNREAFRQQLLKDSRVINASGSAFVPGGAQMDGTEVFAKNTTTNQNGKEIHANIYHIDYDYIPTLGMQVVQGRNFSREYITDTEGVVINEAAVKELGWNGNADAIGKTIARSGRSQFKVIGVVADFHYASVKQKIAPLMLLFSRSGTGIIVKVKTADIKNFLADVKNQWNTYSPGSPFGYYFLDDKFASLYAAEQKTGSIFTTFALVAIIIASLGLFGLAAFITEQRTREIGIRKVLGASTQNVLFIVTKEFLYLVGIACIIAIPVTWLGMNKWLEDFAYRVHIGWWVFALSASMAIVIALLTVSFQAVKAAVANPVKALKSE